MLRRQRRLSRTDKVKIINKILDSYDSQITNILRYAFINQSVWGLPTCVRFENGLIYCVSDI